MICVAIRPIHSEDSHVTSVLITVDAEGPSPNAKRSPHYGRFLLPDQLDAEAKEVKFGISKMMDIADKYNFKISFFLDVTEEKIFGEKVMQKIASFILAKGHDIQLHIDSLYLIDPQRPYLNQYSLEEQKAIVLEECNALKRWTGKWPIAHRAGAYAANPDTLISLKDANIPVDSSFFYRYPKCDLQGIYSMKNAISNAQGIMQLPVTVFEVSESANLFGIKFKPVKRFKKIDINSCTLNEMKIVMEQMADNRMDMAILFMHSWSFVKLWKSGTEDSSINHDNIDKFDIILRFIKDHPKLTVLSVEQFYHQFVNENRIFSNNDIMPKIEVNTNIINYLRRVAGINRNNVWFVFTFVIIVTSVLTFAYIRLKLKKRGSAVFRQ